ncbi:MAG: 3-isopropylmalate dehydratase small subunit [Candidatus Nanopelagicales bacterium]|nr:3-isopropylmalate dehydratase small subunit [Candidatus Nanopelagicales bacterium]
MEKFERHTGVAAPLRASNVDTDQICPAEFLKRITRTGYHDALFFQWRQQEDFVLNHEAFSQASVLVAGPDFGTGSSREHAVWALRDYGFRAVISSRFADIFRGNAGKAGLLTAQVDHGVVERLWALLEAEPGAEVTVDLHRMRVVAKGVDEPFYLDDYVRWRLLEGLDDVAVTLRHSDTIAAFEDRRPAFLPRTG